MKQTKVTVTPTGFPSQLAPDDEKASQEFGLNVGKSIQSEWFMREGSGCRFYNQWKEFHKLRLYARGEQSIQKYKNELSVNGDLSYLNLDWSPVPIIPKFVDIVVNGMSERTFKVKAYSQDAMSQSKRSNFQDMIEGQAAAKDILQKVQDATGANPFMMEPEDLPMNDEETSLYMQLHYKPSIEIAEEESINTILDENDYMALRKRIDYDVATIGIGMVKHEFLMGSGIEIPYVDPATVIYSYTEDPHFKDCFYWGEVKTVAISELKKINPDISKDDLEDIMQIGRGWYDEYSISTFGGPFVNDTCTLLYFNYKTSKKVVYKKKILENGNSRVIKKDDTFNPPTEMMEEGNFEKCEKTIDVWYNGIMVMGSEHLIKWEMAENMVRPKSASQHALPNYIAVAPRMYKGVIDSMTKRMVPFADLIQITHLKLQQVIARVVPDGVFIDADGINEVDLGTGGSYNPEDALRMYMQTGSVIGRSYTADGEFNNARVPIQQLTANSGASKTQMLIMNYNHYLDMIRAVTGLNEASDASTPDPRALVGVQKLAALNSNTATRHILEGGLYIFKALSEALTYRISDILEYADFKDDFANKIGKYNIGILEEIKDLYLYDFGIFIEISPDEEEKAMLEANIQVALAQKNIDIEDAIDIREIKNLKVANQLLKLKRIKKQDREDKMAMQAQAMQGQQAMQVQQMAAQAAAQNIDLETNGKIKVAQAVASFEMEKMQKTAELKSQLMAEEFNYNMQIQGIEAETVAKRETNREDAKDKRIGKQSEAQSKLIDQRLNNLPPQKFESNNDNMSDFDLSEFESR